MSVQPQWGVIGGTGLTRMAGLDVLGERRISTPWGDPSSPVTLGTLGGHPVAFMGRHGDPHRIPPHQVNYRANIDALRQLGVTRILAVNAVGGIHPDMAPATLAIPDQIIDYTSDRGHTFFEGELSETTHIDFTEPYSAALRSHLKLHARALSLPCAGFGTYGCTQGPRLETAAEIRRLERDGCDLVGMTGMPEAALAAEAGIDYAAVALIVNWAAGKTDAPITMDDIERALASGIGHVEKLLMSAIGDTNSL